MKYAFFVLLFLGSIQSFAIGPCDDSASLQSLWSKKYSSLMSDPSPSIIRNADLNRSENANLKKLAQAFCLLDNAKIPLNFYQYILDLKSSGGLTSGFVLSSCAHTQYCGNTLAQSDIITGAGSQIVSTRILILPSFFDGTGSFYDYKRASILIHESRHVEIAMMNQHRTTSLIPNTHIMCTHGQLANKELCEEKFIHSLVSGGPYSYEVIFYKMLFDFSPYDLDRRTLAQWIVLALNNYFNDVSPSEFKYYTTGLEKYLGPNELAKSF